MKYVISERNHKFFYTYGNDGCYPYNGGWTEVFAPDRKTADAIFMLRLPDEYVARDFMLFLLATLPVYFQAWHLNGLHCRTVNHFSLFFLS